MSKPHIRISTFLSLALLVVCALAVSAFAQTGSADSSTERLRGVELYRQKNYREAAGALKRATKKDKADAEAWYYLGLAYLQDPKALKDASKAFETATQLRPNFANAHTGLGYSLLRRNKNDAAATEAKKVIELNPTIGDAYYILGVTQLRAGAKEEALQNAEAAIKLQPRLGAAYLLKSHALVSFVGDALFLEVEDSSEGNKAHYRQAAEALEKYLELNPSDDQNHTWTEQLESLRYYSNSPKPGESKLVFSGKEVTTKVRVLFKPEPSYTEAARRDGVIGTVVLRCIFTADGAVKHFLIVRALPFGLTEQSIKAARRIKFVPATKDGRPVSMNIQLEYYFNLFESRGVFLAP